MANNDSFNCKKYVAALESNMLATKALIKAPSVLIHHLNRLAKKVTSDMLSKFNSDMNSKIDAIVGLLPNVAPALSDLQKALTNLKACTGLIPGKTSEAYSLDIAIAMIGKCKSYADLPSFVKSYITKALANSAMKSLNSALQENVFGKIDKLANDYDKMLNTSGITSMLQQMDKVLSCMSGGCNALSSFSSAYDKYSSYLDTAQTKLMVGTNFVMNANPVSTLVTSGTSQQKEWITSCSSKISTARTTINNFTLG